MEKEELKKYIPLLERIKGYINGSEIMTELVYVPPAESLRRQANEIEAKERDFQEFSEFIEKITPPKH